MQRKRKSALQGPAAIAKAIGGGLLALTLGCGVRDGSQLRQQTLPICSPCDSAPCQPIAQRARVVDSAPEWLVRCRLDWRQWRRGGGMPLAHEEQAFIPPPPRFHPVPTRPVFAPSQEVIPAAALVKEESPAAPTAEPMPAPSPQAESPPQQTAPPPAKEETSPPLSKQPVPEPELPDAAPPPIEKAPAEKTTPEKPSEPPAPAASEPTPPPAAEASLQSARLVVPPRATTPLTPPASAPRGKKNAILFVPAAAPQRRKAENASLPESPKAEPPLPETSAASQGRGG